MMRLILFPPKVNFLAFICIFISTLFSPVLAQEEFAGPDITNFTYRDYPGRPGIQFALEDNEGLMYFANGSFLLEFDGENWRKIIFKNAFSAIHGMSKDENGKIYIALQLDIGYLEKTKENTLDYVSLSEYIPEKHKINSQVYETFYLDGKTYFTTDNKLYIWDGKKIEVVVQEGIHVSYVANGNFYSRIFGLGLCVLKNNKYELLPQGEKFANIRVYEILPYDDQTLLLGTAEDGFYLYRNGEVLPFRTEIDERIKGSVYLPGTAMPDGNFIVNTRDIGAFMIDKNGNLLEEYSLATGLNSNVVRLPYVDSRNILWLCTTTGVSAVDLNSPYGFVKGFNGDFQEPILQLLSTSTAVYATTNEYIYKKLKPDGKFKELMPRGPNEEPFTARDSLYIATPKEIFEIRDEKKIVVFENRDITFLSQFQSSEFDKNRLYAPLRGIGIAFLYYNEASRKYELEKTFDSPSQIYEVIEDNDGSVFLLTNDSGSLMKIVPKEKMEPYNYSEADVITYTTEDGLPDEIGAPFKPFDKIYYVSDAGEHYIFNEEEQRFFEHTSGWENYTKFVNPYRFATKDSDGNILAEYGNGLIYATKDENDSIIVNTELFKELNVDGVMSGLFIETDSTSKQLWLKNPDGWIYYEGNFENPTIKEFKTTFRSIGIGKDSLIYNGYSVLPEGVKLDHSEASIQFNYVSPVFIDQGAIQYSSTLKGLDDDNWSNWSRQTTREFYNLPAGNYTFQVKSRSLVGQESDPVEYSFSVTTPWYLTWWAYLIYALLAIAMVYMIVRIRTGILRDRQKVLEKSVDERTREVQKRMNELATVNHVSQALTEKLKLNELIQLVGDEMKKLFNADITYLALVDKENNIINFPYQDGDTIAPQKFGKGLTSKIITTGRPLLINKDKDIDAEYKKMGVEHSGKPAISYLGVPIPSEDKIIGVLSVQSTEHESRFTEEDKRLLNTIAINVGIALHNAELYEQARLAKLKAEEANEAKSAFLSTVSHELRTPLTSVLGFAKIIRKRLEDKIFPAVKIEDQKIKKIMKQVQENLNVVVSEGERLTTLINDVLDLAKIESGKMEWNMKPIFLQDAINRALASTQSLFDQKGLKLKKNIPSDLPMVNADEDKLIQVVINLISNSVKFTDSGKVEIEAYKDKDQIIVEVRDTGIGIAEEDHYKVFEKFRQAGDTLTDKPKGTGLGLPICREIIEHHGGIIWMTSEPGVGSTFYFSVPILSKDVQNQPVQLNRIISSLKKQIKHSQNGSSKKATILVVDDATPIRSLLRQELSEAGYHVQEAANGKLALDMVRNSKPDLIILDVMMPEINGFDVAAVLKNDPATMDIPIIILSIVQDKERGLKIGVDRYLTKPINTEQLFHEVDVLLEQGVSKKKVLVVDEDASTVNSLSEVLSARGYKVMNSNGENLYESATENQPDIIMLNSVHNGNQEIIKDIKLQKGMENVMFFIYE